MVLGLSTGGVGAHVAELATRPARRRATRSSSPTDGSPPTFDLGGRAARGGRSRPPARRGRGGGLRRLRALARDADVVHAHGHQAGRCVAALAAAGAGSPAGGHPAQRGAGAAAGRAAVGGRPERVVARRRRPRHRRQSDLVDAAPRLGARAPARAGARRRGSRRCWPRPRSERPASAAPRAVAAHGIERRRRRPLVLTVARLAPAEGPRHVWSTRPPRCADRDPARWVVVGDGDDGLLRRAAQPHRPRGAPVRFSAPQDDPDAGSRAADVVVLTAQWEARPCGPGGDGRRGAGRGDRRGGLRDLGRGRRRCSSSATRPRSPTAVARGCLDRPGRGAAPASRGRAASAPLVADDGTPTPRRSAEWYSATCWQ